MVKGFNKILFPLFCLTLCIYIKSNAQDSVIDNFKNINSQPQLINFENKLKVDNSGGHIQGVQYLKLHGDEYVFLSGSSDLDAYYAVVELGTKSEVIAVNKLMKKPFKHAGGFQIFKNLMAVGIEDNSKKDISKVCIYDISKPENPTSKPISVIEREGEALRSTAGCVGITKYKNKVLIAVGDWDTKHLDFYTCDYKKIGETNFEKVGAIDTENASREGWIDKNWESYQNINLFVFNDEELFLIGLGHNKKAENIADLFQLEETNSGNFELTKLATKTFYCKKESNFKAGAGVVLNANGMFEVYSSTYNIERTSYLNYFKNFPADADL